MLRTANAILLGLLSIVSAPARAAVPYRLLPSLAQYRYACITGNDTYRLIASRAELEGFVKEMAAGCGVDEKRYLDDVAKGNVDFDREALVLIEKFYGGTGMARASLLLTGPDRGIVTAAITITVPPPPVTPDVARFPFAFAVRKEDVDRVDITIGKTRAVSLHLRPKRGTDRN